MHELYFLRRCLSRTYSSSSFSISSDTISNDQRNDSEPVLYFYHRKRLYLNIENVQESSIQNIVPMRAIYTAHVQFKAGFHNDGIFNVKMHQRN